MTIGALRQDVEARTLVIDLPTEPAQAVAVKVPRVKTLKMSSAQGSSKTILQVSKPRIAFRLRAEVAIINPDLRKLILTLKLQPGVKILTTVIDALIRSNSWPDLTKF